MSKPKKKTVHDTHLYLPPDKADALALMAKKQCRSVTGQALHYVLEGLTRDLKAQPA